MTSQLVQFYMTMYATYASTISPFVVVTLGSVVFVSGVTEIVLDVIFPFEEHGGR